MPTITDKTLKKAVIKNAKILPLATTNAIAFNLKMRSQFLLGVLQSSDANQTAVRSAAAASNSPGRRDLAVILAAFATLSAPDKASYITAVRRRAALAVTGTNYVAARVNPYSWGGGGPPRYVP